MNYSINNSISFKGFDNICAGRHVNGQSGVYVISMRLNNIGEPDLDRFAPVLKETSKENILTIHYENIAKNQSQNCPKGISFIDINKFPLIIDKKEVQGLDLNTIKEVEKTSIPLAQNAINLLKRVVNVKSPLRDSSLATYTAMDDCIDSICGEYANLPDFKNKATKLIMGENNIHGEINVIKDVSKNIINAISDKMIKYFK